MMLEGNIALVPDAYSIRRFMEGLPAFYFGGDFSNTFSKNERGLNVQPVNEFVSERLLWTRAHPPSLFVAYFYYRPIP